MTTKKDWGPHLWKILHGLAESLGNQTVAFLATDEAHEVVFLLRDVDKIMPCALCRSHYNNWRRGHPLEEIDRLRGPSLREGVKRWLYDLHEDVNKRNNITSNIPYEQLTDIYKPVDIRTEWAAFFTKIKLTTEIGISSPAALTTFHRHLGALRKLVGR